MDTENKQAGAQKEGAKKAIDPEVLTDTNNLPEGLKPQTTIEPTGSGHDMSADVARILGEAKLPERHGTQPAPQVQKQYATAPGASAVMNAMPQMKDAPLTKVAEAPSGVPEPVILEETELNADGSVVETQAKPKNEDDLPSLHTFSEDVQGIMRTHKVSVIQETVMQQEKARVSETVERDEIETRTKRGAQRRSVGLVVTTLTLFILGAAAIGAVIYIASQRSPGTAATTSDDIMFAEQTAALPISDSDPIAVKNQLASVRTQATLTLGAITHIVPTVTDKTLQGGSRKATVTEFFASMGATPPDVLTRTFNGPFFLGIHTIDQNVPVLVISIASYDRALEGMLAWEKTINQDLSPLYTAVPTDLTDANGIPVANSFQDVVINNFDTRVLKDASGEVRMLYAFPSQKWLVIVERPTSFAEVLSRLRADKEL